MRKVQRLQLQALSWPCSEWCHQNSWLTTLSCFAFGTTEAWQCSFWAECSIPTMEIKGYLDLQIIFVIEYLAVKFNVVHEKLFVGRTASKSGEQLIFSPYCLCVMLLVDSYFFHIPISKIPKQKCVSGHSEQLWLFDIWFKIKIWVIWGNLHTF